MDETNKAFLIIVNGGTASGKTTVCKQIINGLDNINVAILSTDNFYKTVSKEYIEKIQEYNFDHPDAFDWELMIDKLKQIKSKVKTEIPIYDFVAHKRKKETITIGPVDVLILEGILAAYPETIRELSEMVVFVDTDSDLRLMRRITRDIAQRGRTLDSVLCQYKKTVKPSFELFCAPLKRYAHIIIPHGEYNPVAINLLRVHIREMIGKKTIENGAKVGVEELSDGTKNYCLFEK